MRDPVAVVLASHWLDRQSELAFVTRSIAGAATRCGPVAVLVPGEPGRREADGAFDLEGIGSLRGARVARGAPTDPSVIVDELTPAAVTLLARTEPQAVLFLSGADGELTPSWRRVHLVAGGAGRRARAR